MFHCSTCQISLAGIICIESSVCREIELSARIARMRVEMHTPKSRRIRISRNQPPTGEEKNRKASTVFGVVRIRCHPSHRHRRRRWIGNALFIHVFTTKRKAAINPDDGTYICVNSLPFACITAGTRPTEEEEEKNNKIKYVIFIHFPRAPNKT